MSSGGPTAVSPPEPQAFKRAARKIKCAVMVANLAKSWQGWAAERSEQQDAIPSGWMPESGEENGEVKPAAAPRVIAPDPANANANAAAAGSKIRTGAVNKSVQPRRGECGGGGDVFNAIRGKMESGPAAESKPFLGNESPTRRRQMRALQEKQPAARSGGVDTGARSPGEEAGPGDNGEDNGEAGEIKTPRHADRPKVKISPGGDVKRRWQQWSVQHMAGQRLNPFSEDFDHDFAMAQRLRKGDDGYGRPKDGSKTAERGDRAQKHVHREMEEMVWIIRDMGIKDQEGRTVISFGRLFDRYVKISDKVVGIALRCRKHKMLDFEGEMLWKGQDDHVIITLTD